jgi:hypothetical protein
MERKLVHGTLRIVLVSVLFSTGCAHQNPAAEDRKISGSSVASSINPHNDDVSRGIGNSPSSSLPRVTQRSANTDGAVFVVEYHHLGYSKDTMFRSPEKFRADLDRFYRMGFRPVTVTEYLANRMPLAPGASPVVFTFDDANPDQVKLNPDETLAPDCFLGIWQDFAKLHPDFPVRATFFVLPTMWGQHALLSKKLGLLKSLGCELGNHTITHTALRKLPDDRVEWEVGEAELRLINLGVPSPAPLALPLGSSPKNKTLLAGFDYKGVHIAPTGVFLVGANPAPARTSPKFDHLRIPRIQACEGLDGLDYWFQQLDRKRVKLYVAGG